MATMKVLVRPARSGDWLGVWEIEQTLPHPWDITHHKEFMAHDRSCTYVCENGEHVLGFVSATVMPGYVDVERVGVSADARRLGVGRGMLESLEGWFLGRKRTQMHAVVGERDLPVQLFLRACGWEYRKSIAWGDTDDEYLFVKAVSK